MNINEDNFRPANGRPEFEPIFVARQPLFTPRMNIWGYELLFRHSLQANSASFSNGASATSKILIDGFSLAQQGLNPKTRLLINFPRDVLLDESASILPPDQVVIEVLENIIPDKEVLKACIELKRKGFILALDDFQNQRDYNHLFQLVDLVKIDIQDLDPEALAGMVTMLKDQDCMVVAEKVETKEMFELMKDLGCDLFQGFFFSRPEVIPGRTIPGNKIVKLRLLHLLNQETSFDPKKLGKIIQTDLSLSYRLLRYINSPWIGLPNKVKSIQHAISLLGYKNIVRWLRVLLLADLNTSTRGRELTFRSAQRGRFLELLAETSLAPFDSESMFLLGLFSLLDAILDQPMSEVLTSLPLTEELEAVLSGEDQNGAMWLDLIALQEQAQWMKLLDQIHSLNLKPEQTAACYVQALQWASHWMGMAH